MVFGSASTKSRIGTTTAILVQDGKSGRAIAKGKEYFLLQIVNAQAVYKGSIWENAKQLVVASKISIGGEQVRGIQRAREIRKNQSEQLGLETNIVDLIPAAVDRVSVSIEFLLDRENRLSSLAGLINDNSFVSLFSLAAPQVAAAKAIGGVAQRVIDTFFDVRSRVPILEFSGDFNVATGSLKEAYYAILGTTDPDHPLPDNFQTLTVHDNQLYLAGLPVEWSYLLFQVTTTPVRTKDLGHQSAWYQKLLLAEARAIAVANNPFAPEKDRMTAWEEAQRLINEANLLISVDPLYLPSEARSIIQQAYVEAREAIFGTAEIARPALNDETKSRLGIRDEAALALEARQYKTSAAETKAKLATVGFTFPTDRPSAPPPRTEESIQDLDEITKISTGREPSSVKDLIERFDPTKKTLTHKPPISSPDRLSDSHGGVLGPGGKRGGGSGSSGGSGGGLSGGGLSGSSSPGGGSLGRR